MTQSLRYTTGSREIVPGQGGGPKPPEPTPAQSVPVVANSPRAITLGTLNIGEQGKRFVNDVLNSNRLSNGKYTKDFESTFAAIHQSKYGVFCNSGTSALQIALAALKEVHGYEDGDEVLVPATTFIATSNIVIQNNLKPVFVDVDPNTFNMNPEEIASRITKRTRAIIPVHLFGLPADMPAIMRIANDHYLQVIEDSCETMFAGIEGKSVGSFGHMACFSTYVAHLVVGGVGGLVITKDLGLEERCRSLMAHGRDSIYTNIDQDDTDDQKLKKQMIERRYSFDRIGYSYRCTELEAAIALSELYRGESNIAIRRSNAAYLTEKLRKLDEFLQLPIIPKGYTHSFMMFPLVLRTSINRDDLLLFLENHNIETRYLFPLLTQPIYKKLFPGLAEQYPVAQLLGRHGFFIGMHQSLTKANMDYIANTFYEYFEVKA
jgi:dTDP-4-amino-4,6-dideoxygalactose transaminase